MSVVKPCPFCGCELIHDPSSGLLYLDGAEDGTQVSIISDMWVHPMANCVLSDIAIADAKEQIDAWNRRSEEEKLAAYEVAEEQGLLVRLPCKVGDTVYRIVRHRVDVSGYRMEWEWETTVEAVPFRVGMVDAIGKTIFLTREEAEAALKGETEDV